jgi:hypothetical protein
LQGDETNFLFKFEDFPLNKMAKVSLKKCDGTVNQYPFKNCARAKISKKSLFKYIKIGRPVGSA